MEFLSQNKLVHWDFKLANVLWGKDGNAKIADLDDISSSENMKFSTLTSKPSTVGYKAPERYLHNNQVMCGTEGCGKNVKLDWTKSDAYSVGISLLEMHLQKDFNSIFEDVMGFKYYEIKTQKKNEQVILQESVLQNIRNGTFQKKLLEAYSKDPFVVELIKILEADPRMRISLTEFKELVKDIIPREKGTPPQIKT